MFRTRTTDAARHRARGSRVAVAGVLLAGSLALPTGTALAVTGTPSTDSSHAYTARLDVGDATRGCSGVLVDSEWLLTAASCFADDPAQSLAVPPGKPRLRTTATIGRPDLNTGQGAVRQIVELVPRTDRDLVLARLARPVTNVAPIELAATEPTAGERLRFAGYGRTAADWVPSALHTGGLTVDATTATTASYTGEDGAAVCQGDAGGPVVRVSEGVHRLAAVSSRSFQGGCFGVAATESRTGGIATRVDDLASWVNARIGAPPVTDFNCDGVEDIAVGDPRATVDGQTAAGVVRVSYGGGKGTAEINQNLDWVPGGAEPEDWFGEVLDTVDHNEDGCTDLVVGIPAEDLGGAADAGMTEVLYGAVNGLGTAAPQALHLEQGTGSGALAAAASQAGDRMGHSVAAGRTAAGEPYLLIGVPGQGSGTLAKAGLVFYLRGATTAALTQNSQDVPGGDEANDGFGTAVAADANHFAVGAPNEAIGDQTGAGGVWLFRHPLSAAGVPAPLAGIDQDSDLVDGGSEAGDRFGAFLSMTEYRPAGAATATDSVLAIGSPGEGLAVNNATQAGAGRVVSVRVTAAGTWNQLNVYWQGPGDDAVAGAAEADDHFGDQVTVVNTAPRAQGTAATLRLAVGIAGEDIDAATDAGAVQTFSLLGAPGDSDHWLQPGTGGIPGTPGVGQYVGHNIHFTGTRLYVGMPYGPAATGALHALPMSNATAGGAIGPVTTYRPGTGGLPAVGDRFGHSAR